MKKNIHLLATLRNNPYLCNVKCMFDYPVNIQSECRGEQAVLPLKTLKSTIVPSYHLRFYNYWVGMVYYIYIHYYIYYNIYNNVYKSIGGIFRCKVDFRFGTMVRWYEIEFADF